CNKKDVPLQIEHIIPKSRGGTNKVSNLTISCEKCNLKKNNQTAKEFGFPGIQTQALQSLKATAFMNNVKKQLIEKIGCESTYGYITKYNRIKQGLEKSHSNDAFIISQGTNQERVKPLIIKQTTRNNRCLQLNRKGFKPSIRRVRYALQPKDKILYRGNVASVNGVHSYGKWVAFTDALGNKVNSNIKNVRLLTYGKGIVFG
ncbi:MAG: HNH endonuclease, partial [Candidatus Woesearchaeota archaeon]